MQKSPKGKLYLIPASLGSNGSHTIPEYVKQAVAPLDEFIVENERSARRFLREIGYHGDFDVVKLHLLDKQADPKRVGTYLTSCEQGKDIGLLSEAGLPAIADPGSVMVELAHEKGIQVVPLVGPSSILLALMASGFSGQSFSFHGYLPREDSQRNKAIQHLEQLSQRHDQTQIFMEAPHRNNKLIEAVVNSCQADTAFCIACDLTLETEWISSQPIKAWKEPPLPDIHKRPAIFLLYSRRKQSKKYWR